jgi:hypothetical protein
MDVRRRVRFPAGAEISLFVTGSEAHPASYRMSTVDSFPAGKSAGEGN